MPAKAKQNRNLSVTTRSSVTQSNDLIEASYRLDIIEKRLLLCLLSKIHNPRRVAPKSISLDANEYIQLTNTDKRIAYRDMKTGADGLMGKFLVTAAERKSGNYRAINWMDNIHYFPSEGRIEASFSESLRPLIGQLSQQFTRVAMEHLGKFRSVYTIRIFELLMQFKNAKASRTPYRVVGVAELREMVGIAPEQYAMFADLRKRVIDPAVREINQRSNYMVEWSPLKKGRIIHAIKFDFDEKLQREFML